MSAPCTSTSSCKCLMQAAHVEDNCLRPSQRPNRDWIRSLVGPSACVDDPGSGSSASIPSQIENVSGLFHTQSLVTLYKGQDTRLSDNEAHKNFIEKLLHTSRKSPPKLPKAHQIHFVKCIKWQFRGSFIDLFSLWEGVPASTLCWLQACMVLRHRSDFVTSKDCRFRRRLGPPPFDEGGLE